MDKNPDLSHIRFFGARAYVHVPKAKRVDKKFSQRAQPGFPVGYERGNSFRVYLPENNRVVVSRDVNVDKIPKFNTAIDVVGKGNDYIYFDDPFRPFVSNTETNVCSRSNSMSQLDEVNDDDSESQHSTDDDEIVYAADSLTFFPNLRRSVRNTVAPERFGFEKEMMITPSTYEEAVNGPHSKD